MRMPAVFFAMVPWLCLVASLMAQRVPVIEKSLPNGLTLLMVERHDDPTIAGGWVAHVGSANERPGITGIAHLFEHMMFKGTPTIGTKNYRKDLQIITDQEKLRDEMRKEEAKMRVAYRRGEIDDLQKPENKTPRYKELEKKFNELIAQQREPRLFSTPGLAEAAEPWKILPPRPSEKSPGPRWGTR